MRKVFFLLASLIFLTLPAKAALISVIPSDSNLFTGEHFDVEIRISALQPDEVVALFDLMILFDPAALQLTGSTFGTGLGDGGIDSWQETTGTNFYAFSFLDDVSLKSLQGSAFTLFTLNFKALSPSLASVISLEINAFGLLNYDQAEIAADIAAASITIEQRAQTVSAPSNLPLLLMALTSLAIWRRTRRSG